MGPGREGTRVRPSGLSTFGAEGKEAQPVERGNYGGPPCRSGRDPQEGHAGKRRHHECPSGPREIAMLANVVHRASARLSSSSSSPMRSRKVVRSPLPPQEVVRWPA